jgi:hypothetical protein
MQLPNRFYAIEFDGIHRITINDEYIGTQSELLRALSKSAPKMVKGVLPEGIHLEVSAEGMAMATMVHELNFNTFFRPIVDVNEKVNLVPVWRPPGSEMKFKWIPPKGMLLYFVMYWGGDDDPTRCEPIPYLVAVNPLNKRIYLLPIPNLYDDGRICLGRDIVFSGVPAMTQLEKGVKILMDSRWNGDLLRLDDEHKTHELFRWDSNGKQVLTDRAKDWPNLCTIINSSVYRFVAGL